MVPGNNSEENGNGEFNRTRDVLKLFTSAHIMAEASQLYPGQEGVRYFIIAVTTMRACIDAHVEPATSMDMSMLEREAGDLFNRATAQKNNQYIYSNAGHILQSARAKTHELKTLILREAKRIGWDGSPSKDTKEGVYMK